MRTLEVVVGAQFGSEAKGHVVQRLTERAVDDGRSVQVVRVAGPNAGHTGYDRTGRAWALRQVPVAAVVDGPLLLGIVAGSEIDMPVLLDEVSKLNDAGLMKGKTLWVSGEATLITDDYKNYEAELSLVKEIGSTGKGIGGARSARIMRKADRLIDDVDAVASLQSLGVIVAPSGVGPIDAYPSDQHLIIEGTQGYGLGLHAGFYPQCTSSDCRAADFMAMAGVHAWQFSKVDVWAVARVFPIRVAGNSGPLKGETTWEELGLPEERTTVTKKVRRVGREDWDLVREAVRANGGAPTVKVALTMLDQKFPGVRDRTCEDMAYSAPEVLGGDVGGYIADIERQVGAKVAMITTGPNTGSFTGAV